MVGRIILGPGLAPGILFAALKGDKSSFPCEQCWGYLWICVFGIPRAGLCILCGVAEVWTLFGIDVGVRH